MSLRLFASRGMNLASRQVAMTGRRAATTASKPKTAQDIIRESRDFKGHWLSDPSTYPIIAVMAVGITWMVGMGVNGLTYKGVQISPNTRGAEMKDYSPEHKTGVMEKLVGHRVKPEGLGIDHERFVEEKEQYMKN
mmetsp:Transcript_37766/g.91880  ORF Transcript_37766/g.91880 Transcript_37766/m.91880 type:complete len:136 (-) Transcript_37766:274-681(-)